MHRFEHYHWHRFLIIISVCILLVISVPTANPGAITGFSDVHRITLQVQVQEMIVSSISQSLLKYSVFPIILINDVFSEKHLKYFTIFENCSSNHARLFTNSIIYTLTIASYL